MNTLKISLIALSIVASGLAGAAQARDHGGAERMQRDGGRVEQSMPRRGGQERRVHKDRDLACLSCVTDRRQNRQQARIAKGRQSGQLHHREARQLRKQQRYITQMERRFSADGYLSGSERRRLSHAQDRASRNIRYAKHNDLRMYPRSHAHAQGDRY